MKNFTQKYKNKHKLKEMVCCGVWRPEMTILPWPLCFLPPPSYLDKVGGWPEKQALRKLQFQAHLCI